MSTLKVMGPRGHSVIEFDPEVVDEVAEVKAEFDKLIAQGWRGATVEGPGDATIVKEFDPSAKETVMLRPMAGGA